jgi:hypothetical protein
MENSHGDQIKEQVETDESAGVEAPADESGVIDKVGPEEGAAVETDEEEPETGQSRRHRLRERAADKAARLARVRFDQACELAEDMRHKRDCPEEGALPGDPDRRVEFFTATRPRTKDAPAKEMLVVRCIECGEEEVAEDETEKRA